MQNDNPADTLLRLPAVVASTGLSRATIWRQIAAKKFPAPQKISSRCVAWRHSVLQLWIRGEWKPSASKAD